MSEFVERLWDEHIEVVGMDDGYALALGKDKFITAVATLIETQEVLLTKIKQAIHDRRAIYEAKRDAADPLADDDSNRYERMQHTVEAFDHLLAEIREQANGK